MTAAALLLPFKFAHFQFKTTGRMSVGKSGVGDGVMYGVVFVFGDLGGACVERASKKRKARGF